MNSETEPWLEIDEEMYEVIVGNQLGLMELRRLIDEAIDANEPEFDIDVNGIAVQKIILTDKESRASQFPLYEENLWEKVFPIVLLVWVVVLPMVAIGFLFNFFFL